MQQRTTRSAPNQENLQGKSCARVSPPLTRSRAFGKDITNQHSHSRPATSSDPQLLSYYAREIFDFLYASELAHTAGYGYMKRQTDITEKMRAILVDWLVDVHLKFKLMPETLFLTVNVLDRVLERQPVVRVKLQLVGVVALLVASKYEEIYAPEVRDLVHITDSTFSKEEILEMEAQILHTLDFNLTTASAFRFLERFSRLAEASTRTETLAQYLLELSLVEYKMLKYRGSLVAAAALYLACKLEQRECLWTSVLVEQTHYTEAEVRPCARDLCVLMQGAEKATLTAVRKKFSLPRFLEVALISPLQALTPSFKS